MRKLFTTIMFFLASAGLLLIFVLAQPVLSKGSNDGLGQTWPSRTPTPPGSSTTRNPPATATSPGSPTLPSATPAVTEEAPPAGASPGPGLAPTDDVLEAPTSAVGGLEDGVSDIILIPNLPSAAEVGDCGIPPVAQALGPVNVRSGPGIEFETIGELDYQDQRTIVGRAVYDPWWLIQYSVTQQGWVSDQAVTVAGFTGAVPLIAADEDTGVDQTQWNPTPNPLCTPPAQATIEAGAARIEAALAAPSLVPPTEQSPAATEDSTQDEVSSASLSPELPENADSGSALIWLAVVGVLLVLAGVVALLVQRWRG